MDVDIVCRRYGVCRKTKRREGHRVLSLLILRQTALSDLRVVHFWSARGVPPAKSALGVRRKTGVRAWLKSSTRIVAGQFGPRPAQIPSLEVRGVI